MLTKKKLNRPAEVVKIFRNPLKKAIQLLKSIYAVLPYQPGKTIYPAVVREHGMSASDLSRLRVERRVQSGTSGILQVYTCSFNSSMKYHHQLESGGIAKEIPKDECNSFEVFC